MDREADFMLEGKTGPIRDAELHHNQGPGSSGPAGVGALSGVEVGWSCS